MTATATAATDASPDAPIPGFQLKLTLRLIAPLTLFLVLNSLDRVNVSFAALRMNQDLGLSPEAYGLGVSIFFLGYVLLQFPHALSQRRLGARRWIFATIVTWGALATAMTLVTSAPIFYLLRFLLGAAEGGFAPGIVYFLSQWAPKRYRGWAVAGTMLAIPISVVIGAPLSGWLLSMTQNPIGLASWRWMFLIEGLTPMILAFASLAIFDNRLEDARWLSDSEKRQLRRELDQEMAAVQSAGAVRLVDVFRSAPLWGCVTVWFCLMAGSYALLFWMPQMIKQMSSASDFAATALTAIPWAALGVGMMVNAWRSDRAQERFWHYGLPAAAAAVLLAAAGSLPVGPSALICVTLAAYCMGSAQGAFWPIPVSYLGPAAAAAGITLINLTGNSAGLVTPILIGWVRRETGSFQTPIYGLAALMLLSALIMIPLARAARSKRRLAG